MNKIIKYLRAKQQKVIQPILKQQSEMQGRIVVCNKIIDSVPNHEQAVLNGSAQAYHKAVHDASIAKEDIIIYQSVNADYEKQIAAIRLSYSDQIQNIAKHVSYMGPVKEGLLDMMSRGKDTSIHLRHYNAQLDQLRKTLTGLPDDLVDELIKDVKHIQQHTINEVA